MTRLVSNKWAVATVSLGKHPSHTLERKLVAAADFGFQGVELLHADLVNHALANSISPLESAEKINQRCKTLGLEILSLNPLKNFEGNLGVPLDERLQTASSWIELAAAVGSPFLQVPSQFLQNSTADHAVVVSELRTLADMAARSAISIAYEPVAFATSHALWQDGLHIVEAVDRPNFKLCLDSFHIHSRIWADPYASDGQLIHGDANLRASLSEFLHRVPRERISYIQLSDASRFNPPLTDDSPLFDGLEVHDARFAWSRGARPFPLEAPGYFPVVEIAQTWLVDYQWDGWMSLEGFLTETELECNGPEVMAKRARQSIEKLYSKLSFAT